MKFYILNVRTNLVYINNCFIIVTKDVVQCRMRDGVLHLCVLEPRFK